MRIAQQAGFVLLGGITAILIVVVYLQFGGRPDSDKLPGDLAKALWARCAGIDQTAGFEPSSNPTFKERKHMSLWVYRRSIAPSFGTLVDNVTLVGEIRNANPSTSYEWNDDWRAGPPGTSCIFIGGDDDGLRAKVVYLDAQGSPIGEYREVAARFHTVAHSTDDTQWDKPVDAKHSMTPGEGDSVEETHRYGLFGKLSLFRSFAAIRANGDGPWYTCSSHTCCKAI